MVDLPTELRATSHTTMKSKCVVDCHTEHKTHCTLALLHSILHDDVELQSAKEAVNSFDIVLDIHSSDHFILGR